MAEAASFAGRDDEAEQLLLEARRSAILRGDEAGAVRAELAMAWAAVMADRDDSARQHLRVVGEAATGQGLRHSTSMFLAHSVLQRRNGSRKIPTLEPALSSIQRGGDQPVLSSMLLLDRADWHLALGDAEAAIEHARLALPLAAGHELLEALIRIVIARALASQGQWTEAQEVFPRALEALARLGPRRLQGRAMAHYALEVAPHLDPAVSGSPVSWLSRAAQTLGDAATFRDRALLNEGFRRFGRRIQDKAVGVSVSSRFDGLEESIARLRGLFGATVAESDRALSLAFGPPGDSPALVVEPARDSVLSHSNEAIPLFAKAAKLSREVADLMGEAIAHRERLKGLLLELSRTGTLHEAPALGAAAARLVARQLDADHAVVAWGASFEALVEMGRFGEPQASPDHWREVVAEALVGRDGEFEPEAVTTRSNQRALGMALVVTMRRKGVQGVLYADRARRAGQFRDADHQLAAMIADHLALAIERLAAFEESQRAAHTLAVTLDTLQDGVLAVDGNGILTNVNQAAERLLDIEAALLVGKRLADISALAPLAVLISSGKRLEGAVARMRNGVFVVSARPVQSDSLSGGVVATIAELARVQRIVHRATTHRARYSFRDIVGQSPSLLEALRMAHQAATVDASVLVTGQSGTGKELFAQAVHNAGARASEPFVGVNCAAVPRDLLEAELFGYERGAFTGARAEGNPGKFELAGEGTILLDEIGDMPIEMQAKLLRVLQERTLVRLGGSAERPVKARVMATTHRDLDELVQAGRFRLDLLYRLRVIHVHVPPLAARGDDIEILARVFLTRFAEAQRKAVRDLSPEVLRQLMSHPWTGNVRELANVIEREVVFLPADATILARLQAPLAPVQVESAPESSPPPSAASIVRLAEVERRVFLEALRLCGGNVPRAAAALGISKVTFYARLKGWGMHPKDKVEP